MKYDTYEAYTDARTRMAESALLTAWDSMAAFRDDLVLVGGLAIRYLTRRGAAGAVDMVTTDVDFGVSLGISGGQYGSLRDTLRGHGFRWENRRFQKDFGGFPIYIDLLAERPGFTHGAVTVDEGLEVSVVPGIERALANHRVVEVSGKCLLGVERKIAVKVAEVGPLLVLKLNAFGGPDGRKHPKDVSDVLHLANRYLDGDEAAVAGFRRELAVGNAGGKLAQGALKLYFVSVDSLGPVSCAAFRLNNRQDLPENREEAAQIRQQCVTLAQALLA